MTGLSARQRVGLHEVFEMNDQDKVLEIMEQIFSFGQKQNSVLILNPRINERFECTGDSECKRCPEWLKSKPQHGWKQVFIVEAENDEEEERRRQWRGDWCGECFYEGELTRCTCGGAPMVE